MRVKANVAGGLLVLLGVACQGTSSQGTANGELILNGEMIALHAEIASAVAMEGEGGWVAIDVWPDASSLPPGVEGIGPLCLWIQTDQIGEPGALSLPSPWPEVGAPFTSTHWACIPQAGQGPLFFGMRCGVSAEITPTPSVSPPSDTPTPEVVFVTPIPEETAPTPWVAPRFVGVDGQISSAGGTTACETITWTLTDVEMISAGCDGPVETLSFKRLEVSATLLPPGRDWASGGASLCL